MDRYLGYDTNCIFHLLSLKELLVPKPVDQLLSIVVHEAQVDRFELLHIVIHSAFAWLVNFWGSLHARQFNVFLHFCASYRLNIQNEFDQFAQRSLRAQDNVFVSDHMHWDFSLQPEIVEVFPYRDLLLDEFGPMSWKLIEVKVSN